MPNAKDNRRIKRSALIQSVRPVLAALLLLAIVSVLSLAAFSAPDALAADPPKVDKFQPDLQIKIPSVTFTQPQKIEDGGVTQINIPWAAQYLTGIYRYAVGIGAFLAAIMMTVGGFMYLTAGADQGRTARGKQFITDALLGLAVLLSAVVLLYNLNPELTKMDALSIVTVKQELLETYEGKDSESGNPGSTFGDRPALSKPELDKLFKAYASCFGLDWRVLKSIATIESGLRSNLINASGYQGLFQMKKGWCTGGIRKFKSYLSCDDLLDPEVGTASAAATFSRHLKFIEGNCPNSTAYEKALLLYVGHNNGPGVMQYMVNNKACSLAKQEEYVQKYYAVKGENLRKIKAKKKGKPYVPCTDDICGPRGCVCAKFGLKKWNYGKKGAAIMASSGVGKFFPDNIDSSSCPLNTKTRVLSK